MKRTRFGAGIWLSLLLLIFISGCVQESTDGNARIFTYELWSSLSIFVGGLIAAPAGFFLRDWNSRIAWALMIASPIFALGVAPSIFLERARLDETGFSVNSGFWGMTAVHSVKFDELTQITLKSEKSYSRRGRKINYFVVCARKDGTTAKFPASSKLCETAAVEFIKQVANRQIPVINQIQD